MARCRSGWYNLAGIFGMTCVDSPSIRSLPLTVTDAPTNHAIDETLLEGVASGGQPVLRFYSWNAPAVSLGAAQASSELNLGHCSRVGINIVRRASGGAAVLHEAHLGFSLILPSDHWLVAGDIVHSYERLGRTLSTALRTLGATVELIAPEEARTFRPPGLAARACLAGYGPWEPRFDGRKLAGHAQVRRRGVVLYHAIIPIRGDPAALAQLLAGTKDEIAAAGETLTKLVGSVEIAIGRSVDVVEVVSAVESAVRELDVVMEPGELTATENARVTALVSEKYENPEWTFRR